MFAGSRRVAVVLTISLGGIAQAQTFEYAPGTATYRVTQTTRAAQEVMGQKQEIESSSNQVVTVKLARAAKDTVAMDIVLDSISSTNSMGMPTQMTDRLAGLRVNARLSPVGQFYSAKGLDEATLPNAATMTQAMGNFLPRLRGNLARGTRWTDTTSVKITQGGMDIERKTVSRYAVEGDTLVGSERALKLVRTDSTTMTGSGNGPNGPMTMEGTTTGSGSIVVTAKGLFVGATGSENAALKIVLAANGMEVGVTQNATTKVEKIR